MNHQSTRIVGGQHRRLLRLFVAVSLFLGALILLLGMVGPARFLPTYKVQAQDVHTQDVGVTLDGPVFTATVSTGSVISLSVTTGSGDNRLMLVAVYYQAYQQTSPVRTINAVSFAPSGSVSTTLTRVGYVENGLARHAALYQYLGPPISTSGFVTVSFTASVSYGIIVAVANFKGVDQTTPLGAYVTAVYSDTTSPTTHAVTVTTTANDLVFDTVALCSASPVGGLAADSSQAELWNVYLTGNRIRGATSTKLADSTSTIMTWTSVAATTTRFWAMGAVPIKPAAVGPTHTLTIAVDPGAGGTTNPSAGTHTYAENTVITVTAAANTGYTFDHWGGDCSGSGACAVTMDADKTVTATFAAIPTHTLTMAIDPAPGGTTNPAVGTYTYYENTVVTVTAAANTGYTFDHWAGGCSGSGACVVTMDADKTVTATFAAIPTHTLTMAVDPAPGGTTNPAVGLHTYYENTVVTVTAAANVGYLFGHWEGACSGTGACQVTMDADKTVTASFTATNYDLTMAVSPSGGGTTNPAVGAHSYGAGAVVNITATANSGYLFLNWTGDVANADSASTTVTMGVTKTVTANFLDTAGLVQVDGPASSISITSTVSNAVTTTHTTGSGADRLLVVGVSWNSNTIPVAISSVTFSYGAGPTVLSLTEAISRKYSANPRFAAIWYSATEPPPGETGIVTVNFTGTVSNGIVVGATNLAGVDQTTPIGVTGGNDASSSTPGVTLTLLAGNELVVDTIFVGGNPPATVGLTGTNQTQVPGWNKAASNTRGAGSTEQSTGSSVTMSWVPSATGIWVDVAAAIRPAAVVQTGTIIVEKQTTPGGVTELFTFTGAAAGSISDGGWIVVSGLAAGTYYVTETVAADWTLTDIECSDANSWGDVYLSAAEFNLEAGETVTCTFYNLLPMDYGDAPDSYKTLLASNGARHRTPSDFLGTAMDTEADGHPSVLANGDDLDTMDDEDGVTLPATLTAGDAAASVTVSTNYPGTMLDAWIDFNANGVFDHPAEHLWGGVSQMLLLTANPLTCAVPATATVGTTYARFRASSAGSLPPFGFASDGEVEDYRVQIAPPTYDLTVAVDPAAGGTTNPTVGTHSYTAGTVVTVTATPALGYTFTSWSGACTGTGACQVTMDADKTVTATFAATCYALTLGHTGSGSNPVSSLVNSVGCDNGYYVYGQIMTLSGAAPSAGWGIASWYGTDNNPSRAISNTLTMPASSHTTGVNYLRLLGDVNSDGLVNSTDALIVLSADVGMNTSLFCPMNYGDVNGDGYVNSTDALIILSYDVGMTVPFPLGQPVAMPVLITQPPGCP